MAIYEYSCPVCGRFEIFQRMSEAPLSKCPECSKKGIDSSVQKLISAPAFHLKGSGWYKTDYSSSSNGNSCPKSHSSDADSSNGRSESAKNEETKNAEGGSKSESASKVSADSNAAASTNA